MTTHNIRLSRITHPRATMWAALLLVIVFLGFGMVAEACQPEGLSAPTAAAVQTPGGATSKPGANR